jgi:negative regulator of flagellin synthesis FlgM
VANRIQGSDTGSIDTGASRTVERLRAVAPAGSPTTASSAQSSTPSDSVSITDAARSMASLQDAVAGTPEVDAGRVAALSNAIQQGQYMPDPAKIADRLLQLESDLSAASRRQKS